jgi:hypothetical protein
MLLQSAFILEGVLGMIWASISSGGGIKASGMWLSSGSVIARGFIPSTGTEDRASARMLA